MKRYLIFCMLLTGAVAAAGCSGNRSLHSPVRNDIRPARAEPSPVPPGHADLTIVSSLKTHLPGAHSFGTMNHGTNDYQIAVTVNGEEFRLRGELREEKSAPRGIGDPEAGRGIRYLFRKELRLKAGVHRVVAAIPGDGVRVGGEIRLAEGSSSTLTLEPLYRATSLRSRPAAYGRTSFLEGVKGFRLRHAGGEP